MREKDVFLTIDDERFRICQVPADDAARKIAVELAIETPMGPRTKSADLSLDAVVVALFLLDRDASSGARAKHVRNALGLSMHELAYVLGEADQTSVVAREKGEAQLTPEQRQKLKAFALSILPAGARTKVRTMATRATSGDGERLFFWIP